MPQTDRYRFDSKSLLITGGSQGIGAATAHLAARRGAKVMIASPDKEKLEHVTHDIRKSGGVCDWVLCDITQPQQVEAMVLSIDPERERISLGVKQLAQDPFSEYIATNPKGTIVKGTVKEVDARGARTAFGSAEASC